MTTALIRLSPEIIFGNHVKEMELIGDVCQLSLSDLIDFAIAYVEYIDVGDSFMSEKDIVEEYFHGKSVGWRAIEIIKFQRSEIMAYIPKGTVEMHYVRSVRDGVYVYARTSDDVNVRQSDVLS